MQAAPCGRWTRWSRYSRTIRRDKNRAPDEPCLIARNGHASVQIARTRQRRRCRDSKSTSSSAAVFRRRFGGLVMCRSGANPPGSPADEVVHAAPARFPDPLFEDMPFALAANQTAAVWITIYAPAGTPAGLYKGEAVFRAGSGILASVPFQMRVSRATVPAKQTLKVTNWFNLDEKELGRYYDLGRQSRTVLASGSATSAACWRITSRTSSSRRCYRSPNARVDWATRWSYDFSKLDRWVKTFREAGAAELIEGGPLD